MSEAIAEICTPELDCQLRDRVLTLTMTRPRVLNAFSFPMLENLRSALEWGDRSPDTSVIIVTGEGRAFSSGTDLSDSEDGFASSASEYVDADGNEADIGGTISLQIYRSVKPVIGAINGLSAGFGSTMVLPMDFRLGTDNSSFSFIFARRGLMAEACSTWFLPRIVGITRATDWVLTGRKVLAQEALDAGLLTELVPAEQLMDRARALALDLASACSANSIMACRRSMWAMLGSATPLDAHKIESAGMALLRTQGDFAAAIEAFRRKESVSFAPTVNPTLRDFFDTRLESI